MMHWNTVDENLQRVLRDIMNESKFDSFRLVGGTALSLQWGHRMSVDIDIFSDQTYGSIDFASLGCWFQNKFEYVDVHDFESSRLGTSLFLGKRPTNTMFSCHSLITTFAANVSPCPNGCASAKRCLIISVVGIRAA